VVDRVAEMEHLLARCRALISNAGDGDWNRESGEWQLAAAELLRDMDGGPDPQAFYLEPELTLLQAVMRSLGAASTCWTEVRHAGIFDSTRAREIGNELVRWLRRDQGQGESWPQEDPEVTQQIRAEDVLPVREPGASLPDPNEPEDYDGHVAYVTGRSPGLDGVTYVDGTRDTPQQGKQGRLGGYCFGKDGEENRPGSHLVGADPNCPRCSQWYSPERAAENAEVERGNDG
jgi:hypothetical protein